ncbi:MAG TPA: tRNA modification GTPase [Isosphaeraceae bacterium]|jgi:tRNA modification GTPase|nr:tRNA modification GTPase [Isosphaeraceae bacterium]
MTQMECNKKMIIIIIFIIFHLRHLRFDSLPPPLSRVPSLLSDVVMLLDPADTIAAISSPAGAGVRGIVRLSGPRAWAIALETFRADEPGPLPRRPEWRPGRLRVDGLRPTLPAMVALWPGPATYTGQELAEVHMPGALPLVSLVLAHCLARGARRAEPGEFTLRAFLAGKLDLTRAEAVLGVIHARDPAQLDAALRQLAGGLAGPIGRARDRLLDLLAHLEANLDFADEPDVDPLGRAALVEELEGIAAEIVDMSNRLRDRDRPEATSRVVLVGPPNAGKSRLFNALLGADRALVSPVAGTTRDYLSAPCDCDGIPVELVDTAGAELALDAIDARAQALRAAEAARAHLLLDCRSADVPPSAVLPDHPRLLVWTKADLAPAPADALATSAATGLGLDVLKRAIAASLRARDAEADPLASTGARCRECLVLAGRSIASAAEALALGGDELVAIDLRQGLDELGKVVGAVVTDDILDRIFRRFCVGK